ncbi:hypothetical protein [Roseibium sp. RKSG952]|uniref:hypothetical protein n=1 Tax=Roseibium sp. RKSG952 TaxID=2529384 RepID=UPI0012BBCBA0|nr:hypothetical protein [Roseibium sp. RKSG952]
MKDHRPPICASRHHHAVFKILFMAKRIAELTGRCNRESTDVERSPEALRKPAPNTR